MKQKWSREWISSMQARKQRKYRYNAPLHIRHKFLSATLSKELRKRFGRRSFPLRKGDEVEIMRGSFKGTKGEVEKIDMSEIKIYITGVKRKKSDGSEVSVPFRPSNLKIIKLNLSDKKRAASLHKGKKKPEEEEKPKQNKHTQEKKEVKKKQK